MKIGVALSGCDMGGMGALGVLRWLDAQGMRIHMLSSSGTASVPALLFAGIADTYRQLNYLDDFVKDWQSIDLDAAIAGLSAHMPPEILDRIRSLSVNALSLDDGKAVCFTNDFTFQTGTLCTFPLTESYDVLSSTVGPADSLEYYSCCGLRLCDYALQYGCPFFPLHLAGCDKILSFAFVPQSPANFYDVSFRKIIKQTGPGADFHLALSPPQEWDRDFAIPALEDCKNSLFSAVAFGGRAL